MKVISFILVFYVLALSCVPYTNGIAFEGDHIEVLIQEEHNEDEPHTHPDTCPPFCHCLQIIVMHWEEGEINMPEAEFYLDFPEYRHQLDNVDPDRLLQPPRV